MSTTSDSAGQTEASQEWERLARSAGSRDQESSEPELLRELLSFELAGSPYAIPVERVREIVRVRNITPMPRVPDSVLGVVALRGEIVQVLDLRMCLGLRVSEPTRRSRVIVLHGDDTKVTGVLVDGVSEVLRVSESEINQTTSTESGAVQELCARGDEFVSIIDTSIVTEFNAG